MSNKMKTNLTVFAVMMFQYVAGVWVGWNLREIKATQDELASWNIAQKYGYDMAVNAVKAAEEAKDFEE